MDTFSPHGHPPSTINSAGETRHPTSIADGVAALALSTLVTIGQNARSRDAIDRYMTDGRYDRDVTSAIDLARGLVYGRVDRFRRLSSTPGVKVPSSVDALYAPLVTFDVDDTLLSTHEGRRRQFFEQAKARGIRVDPAHLPPIEPVVRFYRDLVNCGVRTAIITGRTRRQADATAANLVWAGVDRWDHLLFRDDVLDAVLVSACDYKQRRQKQLADAGYTIIAVIGDQWSDVGECHHNCGGANNAAVDGVASKRDIVHVKLPNPMYTVY